jgi:hypothetical protein
MFIVKDGNRKVNLMLLNGKFGLGTESGDECVGMNIIFLKNIQKRGHAE